ncbi:MAG: hypothetical protein IKG67_12940 [Parasporobacterium sp.]|nr:hypothetical protein [Parasporobacterium sp.]
MMISKGAAAAVNDFLDNCCEIKAGDEVLLVAHADGLQGGDNLVDQQTIDWLQEGITFRGANASVLWLNDQYQTHKWRVSPILVNAIRGADICILNSFDITTEELRMIHEVAREYHVRLCRNMATTVGLLNSPWAQTPYELVNMIRYEAGKPFDGEKKAFHLTCPLGSDLKGNTLPPNVSIFPSYAGFRKNTASYRPFPEWVYPPINIDNVNGIVVFDRMLSWWSRHIGISPFFKTPVTITVKDSRIIRFEGGEEADRIRSFVEKMASQIGDVMYRFPEIHGGCHPCPMVAPQQCSNPLITRIVDHSGVNNIHFHIGAPFPSPAYPYWMHITGDLQNVTWEVGGVKVYDKGHMLALDAPSVLEIAAKYPDRPGICGWPKSY